MPNFQRPTQGGKGVLSRRVGVNWALTENVFSATRLQNDDARDGSRYKQA